MFASQAMLLRVSLLGLYCHNNKGVNYDQTLVNSTYLLEELKVKACMTKIDQKTVCSIEIIFIEFKPYFDGSCKQFKFMCIYSI